MTSREPHSLLDGISIKMQGAVLIIGSLLWDCEGERSEWRERHLSVAEIQHVRLPIEYGRRSRSRENTFTMTFALDAPEGCAVLVPFASQIDTFADLLNEATALWKAENKALAAVGELGAQWGCVGLRFREPLHDWLDAWSEAFRANCTPAVFPVDCHGILDIPWPILTNGNMANVDFVLATATRRESVRPTVEAVAEAWIQESETQMRYFFENVRHGIRTHADIAIWKKIEASTPRWLSMPEFEDAIAMLRSESMGNA